MSAARAEATVTEAGTVTLALLLDRLTGSPPTEAATVNFTVQLLVPAPVSDAGLQLIPLNAAPAFTVTAAVAVAPAALAVTVTLCKVEALPAVAVNVALVTPEATVTEATCVWILDGRIGDGTHVVARDLRALHVRLRIFRSRSTFDQVK